MENTMKASKIEMINARIKAHKGDNPALFYTKGEEICHGVTHGIGSVASILGTIYLIALSVANNSIPALIISIIYGASLIMLYTMSTLYHSITNEKAKKTLRVFDHSSIFFLIAGSYTPLALVPLWGSWVGWAVCGSVWALAILGIVLNIVNIQKFKKLSMFLYVAMGWAALFAIGDILEALPTPAFYLLVLGGVTYTVGIVFYSMKKVRYMHGVWHLFVIGGSVLHYICVALYVLPMLF